MEKWAIPEMLAQVGNLGSQAKHGSSVYVRMADEFVSDLSKLTARDLDKLAPNNPLMLSLSSSEGIVNTLMLEKAFVAGLRKEQGTNLCPVLWNLRFAGRPKKPRTPATGALHEDFSRRHRSPGDRARWRREI